MLENSEEMSLKKGRGALALMKHRYKVATYHRCNNWLIVVSENVIITMHEGKADKWMP